MKKINIRALLGGTLLLTLIFTGACGDGSSNTEVVNGTNAENTTESGDREEAAKLDEKQLDNIVAPIALYPDPLLAQVLPASTFPEKVNSAAVYVRSNGDKGIDDQDWPVSVKSVAHYPDALYYMSDNPDWTTRLGQAYTLQPGDVIDSIQRLRLLARDTGALVTTKEQEVRVDGDYISLVPAQPEYLYVPQYDPQVVYYDRRESGGGDGLVSSLIKFGAGVAVGIWLNNAFDWNDDRVYYHGWRDDDVYWVRRSRDHYRWDDAYYRDSYYVDDRWNDIYINRDVVYSPVRYDRIRIYDRIYPNLSYRDVRGPIVPGKGDEMRRQDPGTGRPIEKGPPPGQIKKDKYDDRGKPGRIDDKSGKGKGAKDAGPPKKAKDAPGKAKAPAKKGGPPASKGKGKGDGGKGKKNG